MPDGRLPPLPSNIANAPGRTAIPCPVCGGGTGISDSRSTATPTQSIRRRRVCIGCRHRFTTYEVTEAWLNLEAPPRMALVEAFLRDALAVLQSARKRT